MCFVFEDRKVDHECSRQVTQQAGALFPELYGLLNPQRLSELAECLICKMKYHCGKSSYSCEALSFSLFKQRFSFSCFGFLLFFLGWLQWYILEARRTRIKYHRLYSGNFPRFQTPSYRKVWVYYVTSMLLIIAIGFILPSVRFKEDSNSPKLQKAVHIFSSELNLDYRKFFGG